MKNIKNSLLIITIILLMGIGVVLAREVVNTPLNKQNKKETPMKLKIGDKAPDFTLPDSNGNPLHLAGLVGKKLIVLYFYPKDMTSGCTAEACAFRDNYQVFQDAGAEVIGVSAQGKESHREFIRMHNLPFILLSDEKNEVRALYDAGSIMGLPGRVTFVIDKKGIIRHIFNSPTQATKHVDEALRVIKELTNQ
jgi:thioredoxin-dependent peroxiredoxin